jgi:hypothetical protein
MSLYQKFKDLFKKNEEQAKIDVVEPIIQNEELEVKENLSEFNTGEKVGECNGCNEDIFAYQKYRNIGGKKYHKKCWKELSKLAHKQLGI